jgi:hypothetical protein
MQDLPNYPTNYSLVIKFIHLLATVGLTGRIDSKYQLDRVCQIKYWIGERISDK